MLSAQFPYCTNPVFLAPMAGVTDLPFREVCREMGVGYAVGEMTASKPELWDSKKSKTRWSHFPESGTKVVQLVGAIPHYMAQAAVYAQSTGAQVIDINMGCPAKKVLQAACGSALLRDRQQVRAILQAVLAAVQIPVTLKIRTGWTDEQKNALRIALLAQDLGISLLTIHGRTGKQGFQGQAEYDTIKMVKSHLQIPVIANGDIISVEKALQVYQYTHADGVMVGRAALGNPWLLGNIAKALAGQSYDEYVCLSERFRVIRRHWQLHYAFYGDDEVRTFRKHLSYYLRPCAVAPREMQALLQARTKERQMDLLERIEKSLQMN